MLKDFLEFTRRGNVIDLAVAFILGAAFTTIVRSLVDDIIMPPIGLLLGGTNFQNLFIVLKDGNPAGPYQVLADAKGAGAVTINYGVFINSVVAFFLVALVLFLVIRWFLKRRREEEAPPPVPTTRSCPECQSTVPINARRCAYCTSEVAAL